MRLPKSDGRERDASSRLASPSAKRTDKHGRYEFVDFYELRHRAAWWMHVELGMPERLVAVQLGHTDGGKLVRELYGHGDHGSLAEIDRYLDPVENVVPLRPAAVVV
jgi:integrase